MHAAPEHSGEHGSICICVDDFGLNRGVNEGVFELAQRGLVQATSCMVGAPFWHEGAAQLRELQELDVGLHLDFTEHPLQAAARLGLRALILSSYFGGLDRDLVRREIRAQLDAFEDVMGRPPAFVDGHQHVHSLPVIRDALIDEVAGRCAGAATRPWLRSTRRAKGAAVSPSERFKAWFIEQVGATEFALLAQQGGFAQNARLLGVYDFSGGVRRYEHLLKAWIAAAEPGDLLMCHPSAVAAANDPLGAARRAEFEVLSRPGLLHDLLREAGLGLGPIRRS